MPQERSGIGTVSRPPCLPARILTGNATAGAKIAIVRNSDDGDPPRSNTPMQQFYEMREEVGKEKCNTYNELKARCTRPPESCNNSMRICNASMSVCNRSQTKCNTSAGKRINSMTF